MQKLGITHVTSSAYHPQSQGALERYHQTLKTMLRTLVKETNQWEDLIPWILFASRDAIQASLGFSPFQLVFGHNVRGPLKLIKERWTGLNFLPTENHTEFHNHLKKVWNLAR